MTDHPILPQPRIDRHRAGLAKALGCSPADVEKVLAQRTDYDRWLDERIEYVGGRSQL